MRNGGPCNDATHAMADHIDDNIFLLVFLHIVSNEILNLICCLLSHLSDITLSIVLICFGNKKISIRKLFEYPTFDKKHIVG